MTLVLLALTDLSTGRFLGQAGVCVDARYASIAWRGADRLDRRFAARSEWQQVAEDLRTLPADPLPRHCATTHVLIADDDRGRIVLQCLRAQPVTCGPGEVTAWLDAQVRALP